MIFVKRERTQQGPLVRTSADADTRKTRRTRSVILSRKQFSVWVSVRGCLRLKKMITKTVMTSFRLFRWITKILSSADNSPEIVVFWTACQLHQTWGCRFLALTSTATVTNGSSCVWICVTLLPEMLDRQDSTRVGGVFPQHEISRWMGQRRTSRTFVFCATFGGSTSSWRWLLHDAFQGQGGNSVDALRKNTDAQEMWDWPVCPQSDDWNVRDGDSEFQSWRSREEVGADCLSKRKVLGNGVSGGVGNCSNLFPGTDGMNDGRVDKCFHFLVVSAHDMIRKMQFPPHVMDDPDSVGKISYCKLVIIAKMLPWGRLRMVNVQNWWM